MTGSVLDNLNVEYEFNFEHFKISIGLPERNTRQSNKCPLMCRRQTKVEIEMWECHQYT